MSRKALVIFIAITSIYYFFFYKTLPLSTIYGYIFFGLFAVWFYKSIKKYGLINTVEVVATLPFVIISYLILYFGQIDKGEKSVKMTVNVIEPILEKLLALVNENHSGQISHADILEDGYYVYLNMPYGIYPPFNEIKNKLCQTLEIPEDTVEYKDVAPETVCFFFPRDHMDSYIKLRDQKIPWSDVETLTKRLLLRTPST